MAQETHPAGRLLEWRRGWPAVIACMAGSSAGLQLFTYLSSLFVKPLAGAFGWSRGQIAVTTGALVVCAMLLPAAGVLVDRRGVRGPLAVGVAAYVVSYLGLASMTGALWQYYALIALIAVVGGPLTNIFLFSRPIVAAFDRGRGFALSVSLCGAPVTGLLLVPVLQHVISAQGWRVAYLNLATVSLAFGAAAVLLLGRSGEASSASPAAAEARRAAAGASFREAASDRRLWLLVAAAALVCLTSGFYVSSIFPLLSDKGVSPGQAALLASWYAIAGIVSRLAVGLLLDRLPAILVGALALGAPAVALMIFYFASGPVLAPYFVGMGLFAVANGAEADVVCFLSARYFGLRAISQVSGVLGAVGAVGIAAGGMASGLLFDRLGSYDAVLVGGAAASLLAATAVLGSGWLGQRAPVAA